MNIKQSNNRQTFSFSEEININYEVHGTGNTPMVFLHGFGASIETWRDIQAGLEQNQKLFFLDLKGFGLSSKPEDGKYSLEHQADIVLAFLENQNLQDAILVGHSYGGAVCLFTYIKARAKGADKLISRLILIDSAAYIQDLPFFISILRKPLINWLVMNIVPSRIRASYTLNHLFYDPSKLSENRIAQYAAFFNQPGSYNSFVESAKQVIPSDPNLIMAAINTITVPTLILWGANDSIIPVAQAHRLNQAIRNSTLVIIPYCGHIPHEEKPAESLSAIRDFMRR